MGKTAEILAELEEIGATGEEKDIPIRAVEEVSIEKGSPSPRLLDERGRKMIVLSDLVIEEFDRLIESATHIRNAVAEMRDMWRTSPSEEAAFVEETDAEGDSEVPDDDEDDEGVVEEEYPTGVPSPTGTIAITIPESEPLPPEVANLTDADLSRPPPVEHGEGEYSNEGENDDGQVQETS